MLLIDPRWLGPLAVAAALEQWRQLSRLLHTTRWRLGYHVNANLDWTW